MNEDFNFMVTPLVFNVILKLNTEGDACCIDKVYGVSQANEEGIIQNGVITKINTLFPSKKSSKKGGTKGGIQLIKLKKNKNSDKHNTLNVEIEVTFEDKYGKSYKNVQCVQLDNDDEEENVNDMIESKNYFDNTGIRKGILLCKYVELMMQWMESENGDILNVNDEYKKKFIEFMKHYQAEMKQLNDDDLQKELDLMKKLVNNQ